MASSEFPMFSLHSLLSGTPLLVGEYLDGRHLRTVKCEGERVIPTNETAQIEVHHPSLPSFSEKQARCLSRNLLGWPYASLKQSTCLQGRQSELAEPWCRLNGALEELEHRLSGLPSALCFLSSDSHSRVLQFSGGWPAMVSEQPDWVPLMERWQAGEDVSADVLSDLGSGVVLFHWPLLEATPSSLADSLLNALNNEENWLDPTLGQVPPLSPLPNPDSSLPAQD